MDYQKPHLVLAISLVLVATFLASAFPTKACIEDVNQSLANAQEIVSSAYLSILRAYESGANVSNLLVRLNEAEGFLVNAQMAYRDGDLEKAANFAFSSSSIAKEVENDANRLTNSTLSENLQHRSLALIASVLGVTLVVLAEFWFWNFLKRHNQAVAI